MSLAWRAVDDGEMLSNGERFVDFWDGLLVERWDCDWGLCWTGLDVDCKALDSFNTIDGFNMTFKD